MPRGNFFIVESTDEYGSLLPHIPSSLFNGSPVRKALSLYPIITDAASDACGYVLCSAAGRFQRDGNPSSYPAVSPRHRDQRPMQITPLLLILIGANYSQT